MQRDFLLLSVEARGPVGDWRGLGSRCPQAGRGSDSLPQLPWKGHNTAAPKTLQRGSPQSRSGRLGEAQSHIWHMSATRLWNRVASWGFEDEPDMELVFKKLQLISHRELYSECSRPNKLASTLGAGHQPHTAEPQEGERSGLPFTTTTPRSQTQAQRLRLT